MTVNREGTLSAVPSRHPVNAELDRVPLPRNAAPVILTNALKCELPRNVLRTVAATIPHHNESDDMNILFYVPANSSVPSWPRRPFNHLAPKGWKAMSAGSQPTGRSRRVLSRSWNVKARRRHVHSKSWETRRRFRMWSSPCARMPPAERARRISARWCERTGAVDDPAHATGTDEEIEPPSRTLTGFCVIALKRSSRYPWRSLERDRAQLKVGTGSDRNAFRVVFI